MYTILVEVQPICVFGIPSCIVQALEEFLLIVHLLLVRGVGFRFISEFWDRL